LLLEASLILHPDGQVADPQQEDSFSLALSKPVAKNSEVLVASPRQQVTVELSLPVQLEKVQTPFQ
jgi:hypothetical protein